MQPPALVELAVPAEVDQQDVVAVRGAAASAIEAVRARPEMRNRAISIISTGDMTVIFDPKKMERAFFYLEVNACEAVSGSQGKITFEILSAPEAFEIRVSDNGPGIPAAIRNNLFDPFVSAGKPNGTGLGLAIVSKIVHDHGGSVVVESTSASGTVFLVRLPRSQRSVEEQTQEVAL